VLESFPVLVLTGARQVGKSTLIRGLLGTEKRDYRTLGRPDDLELARAEPDAFVFGDAPKTIDEVQREPGLLLAVKRAVDERRRPGQFLLSGSANLAMMKQVSESLAGRAIYLTLYPFSLGERLGTGTVGRWEDLIQRPESFMDLSHPTFDSERILLESGFPATLGLKDAALRNARFDAYVMAYLERDLQLLSAIANLLDFRRLMRVAAHRTGSVINQTEMARDASLGLSTAHRYLNLLEASYLIHRLPAYSVNRTKRLIKSPKLYWCDLGLAASLAGVSSLAELDRLNMRGRFIENLLLMDVLAWREFRHPRVEVLFWRTTEGAEVDLVLEIPSKVVPIEVKASANPKLADTRHLRSFLSEYGESAPHGVILHTGDRAYRLGDRIWSIPIGALLAPIAK